MRIIPCVSVNHFHLGTGTHRPLISSDKMALTLPPGPEPPGPTAQRLPPWLSYRPVTTETHTFIRSHTDVLYYPGGTRPPKQDVYLTTQVVTETSFQIDYIPLIYTGPTPAPPLGTLFTMSGEHYDFL